MPRRGKGGARIAPKVAGAIAAEHGREKQHLSLDEQREMYARKHNRPPQNLNFTRQITTSFDGVAKKMSFKGAVSGFKGAVGGMSKLAGGLLGIDDTHSIKVPPENAADWLRTLRSESSGIIRMPHAFLLFMSYSLVVLNMADIPNVGVQQRR